MNIEHLKSFLAISKHKSLSQAAQSLYITQPTLSSRMTSLENFLNLKLFERSWKGVELTEHGSLFLPQALKMLDKLDDFTSLSNNFVDLENKPYLDSIDHIKNTFHIGMNNYLVDKYAETMMQVLPVKFPELNFQITTASTKELLKQCHYGVLDYILYYDFNPRFPNTKLMKYEEMVVILNEEDYAAIQQDIKKLEKLQKPLYLNSNPVQENYLSYFQRFQDFLQIDNVRVIENLALIRILIQKGHGYSILPETVYDANFKKEGLYKLNVPYSLTKLPIFSTYRLHNEPFEVYTDFLNELLQEEGKESLQ